VDFFCPSESLAIELDGASHDHDAAQAYDQARDRFLMLHDIDMLRFTNDDVHHRLDDVLVAIAAAFSTPSATR
jgi:very-short-patch-repair endonuclease